ncbi:CAP domain-containing protein [Demequina lignilytica]|uniref:CAP domain-containing protein n=1 Tax=Demequina lignilytica TaxID=3051663 RepID=A0AB35MIG2_9MICO|nr:CAP domain-containing protein [Demequina sp. SYSU T0a273]MDN4483553.1 CAP domain-containing protein [Demequina sp. SYSU T0a273]
MTEEREDPRPGRAGRRLPVLLLGIALVGVGGSVAWSLASEDDARVSASADVAAVPGATARAEAITAAEVSPAPLSRGIGVRLPSPTPEPADTPATSGGSTASGSSARSWGADDWRAYCDSPASPTGASSARGLLAAANAERARLGIAPLAWSGDLAAAAESWSAQMARDDESTSGMADALAHNPASPGRAENVGVTASSAGISQARAASTLATGWMRSPGHCRNIMNPAYAVMGAGLAVTSDGTTWYGTENFR